MSSESPQEPGLVHRGFARGVRSGLNSFRSIINPQIMVQAPNLGPFVWNQHELARNNYFLPSPVNIAFREDMFDPIPPTPVDTLMSSPDHRRSSSDASHNTIRANFQQNIQQHVQRHIQHGLNGIGHPVVRMTTPDASPLNMAVQAAAPLRFAHPSISASTSSSRSSTASICPQARLLEVLNEICTEAARRRWHSETQRRALDNLAARHQPTASPSRPGLAIRTINRSRAQGQRSQTPAPRVNAYPYPYPHPQVLEHPSVAAREAVAARSWRLVDHARPSVTAREVAAARSWRLLDYLSGIANTVWEEARARAQERIVAETRAVEDMRTLYRLGTNVTNAVHAAEQGDVYNVDELRDILVSGSALCRQLGCEEGRERCEEMMRDWTAWEEGDIL